MTGDDTLCGWGNEGKVAYFLANSDIIVPRRQEQMNLLCELLPYAREDRIHVLDLGAGFGAISERILQHYPKSTLTCVDGSEAMVAHATKRLSRYENRVKILKADLAEPSWLTVLEHFTPAKRINGGGFDAVVSAIAIHHLSHQRKRELYREIIQLLRPGGIFLNNDVVTTPAALKARFEMLNLAAIQEQERLQRGVTRGIEQIQAELREQLRLAGGRHQSHIAGLSDQLAWLNEAGFQSVDCYWRYLDIAIFGGVRNQEQ